MPLFIGKHTLPQEMSEAEVKAGWEKYKNAVQAKGLKTLHVNYSMEKSIAYCETEAANAQEVQQAHDDAQIPVDEIIQVANRA